MEDFVHPLKTADHYRIERLYRLALSGGYGATVDCGKGVVAVRNRRFIVFHRKVRAIRPRKIRINGKTPLDEGNRVIHTRLISSELETITFTRDGRKEYLDFDVLSGPLHIRSPRPGDRFQPLGMRRKKKVYDFFIDAGVPAYRRLGIPLLLAGEQVVWVVGYRIDERYRVTEKTKRVLSVVIESDLP